MSVSQICDLAYIMQVEQLEEKFRLVEQAFWINRTEESQTPPEFAEIIQKFDEDLHAEFDVRERSKLHQFYGLR